MRLRSDLHLANLGGWTSATDGVDIDDTAVPEAGFRTVVLDCDGGVVEPKETAAST
jgi:hypothetical protein